MKKLLVAAAAAAAFSAQAASVTMYGVMDTGFTYTDTKASETFEMNWGNYAGPRVGLKGTEDLGNGYAVDFQLEMGFASDTGALAKENTIFSRESRLAVVTPYGTLGGGRIGAFSSGSSTLGWLWEFDPFEAAYVDAGVQAWMVNAWRRTDNTIYYQAPTFHGVKIGLQYGMTGENDKEAERYSDNDAFYNLAVRWDGENSRALLGFEYDTYGKQKDGEAGERSDAWSVKLIGVHNLTASLTGYAGAFYSKNYRKFSDFDVLNASDVTTFENGKGLEAYSVFAGAKYVVGKASFMVSASFMDGENQGISAKDNDYSRYTVGLGTHYSFSNRTMLYAITSYGDGDGLLEDSQRFVAQLGLYHTF